MKMVAALGIAAAMVCACATPAGGCRPGVRIEQPIPRELRECRKSGDECPGISVRLECKL